MSSQGTLWLFRNRNFSGSCEITCSIFSVCGKQQIIEFLLFLFIYVCWYKDSNFNILILLKMSLFLNQVLQREIRRNSRKESSNLDIPCITFYTLCLSTWRDMWHKTYFSSLEKKKWMRTFTTICLFKRLRKRMLLMPWG